MSISYPFQLGSKVAHIGRKRLDRETEPRAFWEEVLKPKWDKRALDRAEKMLNYLKVQRIPSFNDLTPECLGIVLVGQWLGSSNTFRRFLVAREFCDSKYYHFLLLQTN